MQSHIDCICWTFLHCVFLNVFSNCLLEKRHSRIGCICLTFLHCASLNVSSNRLPGRRHWLFDFSQLCIFTLYLFKCLVKMFAWKDARSHSLHFFYFSPVCFSNVSSNGMTERMQSHTSCSSLTFPHCTFSKVSSNCLPERMHIRIGCIFWLFSTVSIQMSGQIV